MGHLFIGHGGLTPENYTYQEGMGIVATPPGTTLQFYSDAGQALQGDFAARLSELHAPWPALTSDEVTYNFMLLGFRP